MLGKYGHILSILRIYRVPEVPALRLAYLDGAEISSPKLGIRNISTYVTMVTHGRGRVDLDCSILVEPALAYFGLSMCDYSHTLGRSVGVD